MIKRMVLLSCKSNQASILAGYLANLTAYSCMVAIQITSLTLVGT